MLVSAITENFYQASKSVNVDLNKNDFLGETVFNSLTSYNKKSAGIEKLGLYDSINEWKNFCHEQILSGKLDVIA